MLSAQDQIKDTIAFWSFLRKYYRLLLMYACIGGLLAALATIFIPKEYKSYGLVYPPSSTSLENSINYPNFGYDVEADRLMQILEGRDIRDSVIRKFHLREYYKIDSTRPEWHDDVLKKYYKNITLERTTSMAVLITARAEDPQTAADIVNYIIKSADAFREKLYKYNLRSAFEEAQAEYQQRKSKLDSLELALNQHLKENNLSSLLLLYSDAQLTVDLDKLAANGSLNSSNNIGSEIINYKSQFEIMKEARSRFLELRTTMLSPIPKIYVLNYGEAYYKKISPSFTVNGLVGALLGLFISASILLLRQTRDPE